MDESILGFRFATYQQIQSIVQNSEFASNAFIGVQILACTFIIMKLIWSFVKDVSGGNRMNNVLECLGIVIFISLAPLALEAIESVFASLDNKLAQHQSYSLPDSIKMAFIEIESKQDDSWWTSIQNVGSLFLLGILGIVGFLIYSVDSAIYAIFVLERLIMIEFYRWVFPLFIAFIGIDGLRNKYWHWITGFLGLMILPIPYIAIYNITLKIEELLFSLNKSSNDDPSLITDLLIALVIMISMIGIKFKLLSTVTQKVSKLF